MILSRKKLREEADEGVEERVLLGTILYMYYKGIEEERALVIFFFTAFRNFRYITPAVTGKILIRGSK